MIDHAIAAERGAGRVYTRFSETFGDDRKLAEFWRTLAADEAEHAHKLATWKELLEMQPPGRRPSGEGFAPALLELGKLLPEIEKEADIVSTPDQAFRIALRLETSELDAIYTTLLQESPLKRFPDVEDTRELELGRHHALLVETILDRSRDEQNRFEAECLATREVIDRGEHS